MLAAVAVRVVDGEAEDVEAEEQRAQSRGGGGGDVDADLDDVPGPDWGGGVEEVGAVDEAMDVREAGDCGNARAVEVVRAERGGIVVVPGGGEERGGEERASCMDSNARIRATKTLLRIFNFSFQTRKTGNVPSIRSIRQTKVPCM